MIDICSTPDITTLRWIVFFKSLNLELQYIMESDMSIVNILSRARYDGKEEMADENEDVQ